MYAIIDSNNTDMSVKLIFTPLITKNIWIDYYVYF